jgi:predicted O-methyltransferase YrrM
MQPKHVLELGTGQGASGAEIMAVLSDRSIFTTVNYAWPVEYAFRKLLRPWMWDSRLDMVTGDTTDPGTLALVCSGVDLLFIDTTHEAYVASAEMRLWQCKLEDGAIVVVDDLPHHDMMAFWGSLHYEKKVVGGQGVFRYDASKPYTAEITERTTIDYATRNLYIDR